MSPKSSFYALLGVMRSATQEEIRRAYLKLAKRLHPDANTSAGETELFLGVQQAYQVLSNPEQRKAYDSTLPYEEEETEQAIVHKVLVSRKEMAMPQESQLLYALLEIGLSEKEKKNTTSPPQNICLALDCSTSMKGEKLDVVKATAIQLLRRTRPQDTFSVVTFSDRAEVLIPAARQINAHKSEIKIQMLQTSGGTELLSGLTASLDEVRRFVSPGSINHIIILTDGRTYGDEAACLQLAEKAAETGIGISGLGIGHEWNDAFLDKLASLTGGTSFFVSKPQEIEKLLNEKFDNLSQVVADNVTLDYFMPDGCYLSYAFRIQPEPNALILDSTINLGPIQRDWPLIVLLELHINAQSIQKGSNNFLQGTLDGFSNHLAAPFPTIPFEVKVQVADNPNVETPPWAIVQALSKVTLYRMQEKARQEVEAGNFSAASNHLKKMATHLLSQGQQGLAKTVLLEAEHIEQKQNFSETGEKRIKYGTRALVGNLEFEQ